MRRPPVIAIAALLLLALAGCAPANGVKAGGTQAESQKDTYECERYARQSGLLSSPAQAFLRCATGQAP